MQIIVNDDRSIFAIQQEFNRMFPYLKLEFFSKLHRTGRPSSLKFLEHNSKKLGEFRKMHSSGEIPIIPAMTVSELEQLFGDQYGLGVQVFRKSGSIWLETVLTDNWTLSEQNSQGEMLSGPVEREKPENYEDLDHE